jgi:hypothetical protein
LDTSLNERDAGDGRVKAKDGPCTQWVVESRVSGSENTGLDLSRVYTALL